MKTYSIFNTLSACALILAASTMTTGCRDDNAPAEEPYFLVEGLEDYRIPEKGLDDAKFANGKKAVVRARGQWTFSAADEDTEVWARIYPMEGDDDGIIHIYAEANESPIARTATYRVFLNGVEQAEPFAVVQKGSEPYLTVDTKLLTFKRAGGELSVTVTANCEWDCAVSGADAAVFTATRASDTQAKVSVSQHHNEGRDLAAVLTISGRGEFDNLHCDIDLVQLYATFFDDFSWLESDAGILGWKIDPASKTKEVRIDKWSDAEKSHGWTSLSTWLYSRTGFIKFGKGGYGGDVASPAIEALGDNANATISWKALGYGTTKNVRDDCDVFYVGILGKGTIKSCSECGEKGHTIAYKDENGLDVTLDAVQFTLPTLAWLIPGIDPTAIEVWQYPTSLFSIDAEGIDSRSRIVFVAGPSTLAESYANPNGHNSRIFLDDFKIVEN